MHKRSILIVACLISVSLLPAVPAQDSDADPRLQLAVDIEGDGPLSFDTPDTYYPGGDLDFTLRIRNVGDASSTVTVGDPVADLLIRDALGAEVRDVAVDPLVSPGDSVTISPGGSETIAEATWSPTSDFESRDSVVAYYAAFASASLRDRDDLDRIERFRVEERDLSVDAYEERLKFYRYPYSGETASLTARDGEVPVHLQNLADENRSGAFRVVVRNASGQVFASETTRITLGTSPGEDVHEAAWPMVDDDGDRVAPGTYLIRAEITVNGTTYYDEFPATLVDEPSLDVPLDPVHVRVTAEGFPHRPGDVVEFTVNATNRGDEAETLQFDTAQRIDLVVTRNGSREPVWRYAENRSFAQQTDEITLEPNETVTWTAKHRFDEPGRYRVSATVTARQPREAPLPGFLTVFDSPDLPPFDRTCRDGPSRSLEIATLDDDGEDRTHFPPGKTVRVDIVNAGEANYSAGATVTITSPDGETVFEERFPEGLTLSPDQAWTATWNQKDEGGDQVANGTYHVRVAAEGGRVGFGIEIGPIEGRSGTAEGRIVEGHPCRYDVPAYFQHPLEVWTEQPGYDVGETVPIRYRAATALDGTAELTIRSSQRRLVDRTTRNVSLDADEADRFEWDQTDRDGEQVAEGAYIVQIRAGGRIGTTVFHVGDRPEGPPVAVDPVRAERWTEKEMRSALRMTLQTELRRSFEDAPVQAEASGDGGFQRDGRLVQGRHVTFRYEDGGNLTSYTVDGKTLFTRVAVNDFTPRDAPEPFSNPIVAGSQFALVGEEAGVSTVDVRPGPLMVRTAEPRAVDLVLADGLSASEDAVEPGCAAVEGNVSALICGGSVQIDGQVLRVDLSAGDQLTVVRLPGSESPSRDLARQIAAGRIGLEVDLDREATASSTVFGAGFRGVDARPVDGGVRVAVNRSIPDGAAVTLDVPQAALETSSPDEIAVLLDGERINQASSLEAVASCDSDEPTYVVVLGRQDGEQRAQVVVCITHFSERTITVQNLAEVAQQPWFQLAVAQAFLVAVVVTLAATVAVFRRPGRQS